MTTKLRVFVSATTRDLGSARRAVAAWLRAQGHEPVVQDEFDVQPDYVTIARMLRDKVRDCDAVVCLIGDHYGAEPKDFPPNEARRSYTQLEYEIGKVLRRPVHLFFTTDECPRDAASADPDGLQKAYRDRLQQRNEIWYSFGSERQLLDLLPNIAFRPAARRPSNLPFESIGTLFKGRDEFLTRLRASLVSKPTHAAAVFSRQAIHGLGGVGKTRAAVEYGLRHAEEYTALLYVTADSPSSLSSNLAGLCGAMVLNLPEQDDANQTRQAAAAVRWLERHPGWFLILDNVDTEDAASAVEQLLGRLSGGHTVITSRLPSWGAGVEPLELDVLDESPAAEFLLERTAGKRKALPTDAADARTLARDVDGLALALEQAGAFVVRHRCSLQDYRTRWRAQDAKVLEWHNQREMKYPRSVATTWQTSVEAMGEDGRGLLNVLCWLAPEPVPLTMLAKLGTPPGEAEIDVEAGCADLAAYSLVKWNGDNTAVKAHRLVLDVTRYHLEDADRRGCLERALGMVNEFVVEGAQDVRTWKDVYDPACDHALAVTAHADEGRIPEPTARLMNQMGVYLVGRARHAEAEPLYRRALAIDESNCGPDHPDVATTLNNLAGLLEATNRYAQAEPLYRRALAIDEASYGPDHPTIAIRLNNLAGLLYATNRHADAEPLFRQVGRIFEASYGPNHPNVATALNNLASLLEATNRYAQAEPLYRRALAIDEASYGADHPNVAIRLNNLAGLLRSTNRHAEAEPLLRRALVIDEASHDPNHPTVAIRLNNLASLLRSTNRYAEAEPLLRRALVIDEASYGPDHPGVATTLNNLAGLLEATNRYAEAEPLLRRALAIDETSYGPEHPTVAIRLNNLAELLRATNRHADAEPLYRRSLAISEASYGPEHPTVAIRLNNLAGLLRSTNRHVEAEPLYRRALIIDEASYGPDHPNVARDLNNLADLLRVTKRHAEAEPLFQRVTRIFEASYGADHPNVAICLNNLASLLRSNNRHAEAELLYARCLRILSRFQQLTGHQHPNWEVGLRNYNHFLTSAFGLTQEQADARIRELLGLPPLNTPAE
jgi:tetratricopeptide (TPR) repeat protein